MKKIAIFGGSFNPSTLRHFEIGKELLRQLPLDEVWYLVSPQNPFKSRKDMASFDDRVAMARLNVAGNPKLVVTRIEQNYLRETGQKTIESATTLRLLKRDFSSVFFLWVVGGDNFAQMHRWGNYNYIVRNTPIIVVERVGYEEELKNAPLAATLPYRVSATQIMKQRGWFLLHGFSSDINATACRLELAQNKRPKSMRASVARYALSRDLYAQTPHL